MTATAEKKKQINKRITWFIATIDVENSIGNVDYNRAAEDFFCGILNILFDLRLQNLNYKSKNFPGIDLGDSVRKIIGGAALLSIISWYAEKIGILLLIISAGLFALWYYRKRSARTCSIDCECKSEQNVN